MEANRPEAYEHFSLIRNSPSYRNYLMLEEIQARLEPSHCQDEEPEPVNDSIQERVLYPIPKPRQLTSKEWNEFVQLQREVKYLHKVVREVMPEIDPSYLPKRKRHHVFT